MKKRYTEYKEWSKRGTFDLTQKMQKHMEGHGFCYTTNMIPELFVNNLMTQINQK